jgi:putative PIN family toxin of toxin-antitoxin system
MQKVVLDTNVLVSALWSINSNPYKIVEKIFLKEILPCFTVDIVEEYSEVLFRKRLNFQKEKVIGLLHEITKNGILTESITSDAPFTDESDRKFYDTAKAYNAFLITGNLRHYPKESFILSPLEYLQR